MPKYTLALPKLTRKTADVSSGESIAAKLQIISDIAVFWSPFESTEKMSILVLDNPVVSNNKSMGI
jgi:hypothetical protein